MQHYYQYSSSSSTLTETSTLFLIGNETDRNNYRKAKNVLAFFFEEQQLK
jgi:hypothetical protein